MANFKQKNYKKLFFLGNEMLPTFCLNQKFDDNFYQILNLPNMT